MSLAVSSSAATCLPPLRCALAGQTSTSSTPYGQHQHQQHQQYLPSFSTISGASSAAGAAEAIHIHGEEDDALPLLMSMAQIQTKAAVESTQRQLPTISSLLPSVASQFSPSSTTTDRSSSSSPLPQSSPPSPSTLSPGLFTGSSMSVSSASTLSPSLFTGGSSSSCSSSAPSLAASSQYQQQQHAAFNNLMELSDIISSTQKLPVPTLETKHEQGPRAVDSGDDEDDEFDGSVSADSDATSQCDSPPVSSRTRRVTRNQQKQIDRIKSEIELERERARELEQTLQFALRERSKLLAAGPQVAAATGGQVSFFNVLNATADGSQPLVLVDLPRSHSLPSAPTSEMSDAPRPSSEGRSRSAPMLPPIASIPGLSPYLARKRGSLPPPASVATSPLRPTVAVAADTAYARGLSRRRKSVDRDDADEDYDPMSGAKKVKRTRSMSERGRRLQGSSGTRRRRSETQYARSGYADEDDHAGHAAATFMAMRAKAIEEERHARESRLMDVVEGADQEDDVDDSEYHRQRTPSRLTAGTHARRDSVLDFIKEHPHASFWLKARN